MGEAGPERRIARLGEAEVELTSLEPGVWEPLAEQAAGPAGLCLALLERGRVAWRGVGDRAGRAVEPNPESLARLPVAAIGVLLPLLRAPWLEPGQQEALDQLGRYLEFRADFPGIDCAACREQQRAGEGEPDCAACPLPPLSAVGLEALRLAMLLRAAPPGAGSLLPRLLADRSPGQIRLLLSALELVGRRLGPPLRPIAGMLE